MLYFTTEILAHPCCCWSIHNCQKLGFASRKEWIKENMIYLKYGILLNCNKNEIIKFTRARKVIPSV